MRSIISTSRSLVSPSTGLNNRLCTGRTTLGKYNSKCTKNNNNNSKILQNIFNTTNNNNILSSKKKSYTLKKAYDMLELGPIPESLQKYKNHNVILHLIIGKKTRFWIGYIEIVKVKDFFIKIGHEKMNNNNNLNNKKLQTLSTLIAKSSGVKNINNNNNNNPVSTPKRKSTGGASGIARALTAVAALRL